MRPVQGRMSKHYCKSAGGISFYGKTLLFPYHLPFIYDVLVQSYS